MCGIFGVVVRRDAPFETKRLRKTLERLFVLSQVRGMESSGLVIKNHDLRQISVARKSCKGSRFVRSTEFTSTVKSYLTRPGIKKGLSVLGHTRIATNGRITDDNQPVVKDNCFGVHNGIICNIEHLWEKHSQLDRNQAVDTEWLLGIIKSRLDRQEGKNVDKILWETFDEIEGTASFGLILNNYGNLFIGTNCGSLYYWHDKCVFLFASESHIVSAGLRVLYPQHGRLYRPTHARPPTFAVLDESTHELTVLTERDTGAVHATRYSECYQWEDRTVERGRRPYQNTQSDAYMRSLLQYDIDALSRLRRCSRCILPATHPFIDFDDEGVCNYCRNHELRKESTPDGKKAFEEHIAAIRETTKSPNCIVLLSGGRDSCYALHTVKRELGLDPIAFSYDWGMLTDLGRRNQSRMCAALGVEHIVVSADIRKKRQYIRQNVEAFLHKPHLGTIGLFMVGDKAYHHFASMLQKRLELPLFSGGSPLEQTHFKEGFSGLKPGFIKRNQDRFRIVAFFALQSLKNPKYLNSSALDTLAAYKYYYLEILETTNLYHYLDWNEDVVNGTLINEYNWEVAPDTSTTWRIGDGTASFYNYIYVTAAGFSENDCFRSNQVREGIRTRDEALKMALEENEPRLESLRWYCDTIGVDLERAINIINSMPRLYESEQTDSGVESLVAPEPDFVT
jgi:asparagine synthetase B (glutamine-hydrolysing)